DLPQPVVADEAVVKHVDLPPRGARVGVADHGQLGAADKGFEAAGHHLDYGIERQVVVQDAVAQTLGPHQLHGLPHARLALVDRAGDLDHAVVGEEVDHVVPHAHVDIIAIGVLDVADVVLVVQRRHALRQRGDGGAAGRRGSYRLGDRDPGLVDGEVIGNDR